jgi:hypothetical protein
VLAELTQELRCHERAVDRQEDGDLVRGCAQARHHARDRRLRLGRLDEHLEGEVEVALADGDPFVTGFTERPPCPLCERLPAQTGERLRRTEPRGSAADEQDAGQRSIRHGSV